VKLQMEWDGKAVSIALPGRYKLSGEIRQSLRQLPGVMEVRDL
jgi:hypothetical protein